MEMISRMVDGVMDGRNVYIEGEIGGFDRVWNLYFVIRRRGVIVDGVRRSIVSSIRYCMRILERSGGDRYGISRRMKYEDMIRVKYGVYISMDITYDRLSGDWDYIFDYDGFGWDVSGSFGRRKLREWDWV